MTDTSAGPVRSPDRPPDPDRGEATASDRPIQPEDIPGIRLIIGGVVVAVLAPLFGLLVGTMIGTGGAQDAPLPAVYVWLVGGIAIGALGALVAIIGGVRLVRRRQDRAGRSTRQEPR